VLGDALGCFQDAHGVVPGQFAEVGRGPAAVEQFGEQVRVAGNVAQVGRGVLDAVEVAAEADVVDAGDLSHVVKVIGDDRRARLGPRVGGGELRTQCLRLLVFGKPVVAV